MKKYLTIISAAMVFLICCACGISAYADGGVPVDISAADITLSTESYTYNGNEKKPKITASITQTDPLTLVTSTKTLVKDTDYTVSYLNNINAGSATALISGKGSYTGTVSKSYTIVPCKMTSNHIKITNTQKAYTNKAPKYSVYYDSALLTEGVDYKITVSNISKTGLSTGKVVFEGLGNYNSAKELKINVYPNKVTSFKTKNRTTTSLELNWASQSNYGVTGYKVYTCDSNGNNAKLYATVKSNSCKVTGRKAGNYYYFKVRAYKASDEKTIYGDYSKVFKTCAKPATVTMRSVTKSKDKKKLTIKWNKVGCTGYEVEYTTDKNFKKGVKTITVKGESKTSKTVEIPKNNTVYYARVRAFRRYNNNKTKVNGKRSKKISSSYSKLYASYSTNYVNNPNRTTNLKLACKAINGKIVYPGETFSFNKTVGKRTAAKGYKEAYVFTGPNSHTMGVGGGVCQVATTMFNAALKANFSIVERHQHSQRVTYCPLGRDAAIYWGSEDFKFRNNTSYPIKIKMKCEGGKLTCSYYVCYDVSPKKVSLSVSRSGNNFTLKRKVDGKVNYTAHSNY